MLYKENIKGEDLSQEKSFWFCKLPTLHDTFWRVIQLAPSQPHELLPPPGPVSSHTS